MLNYPAHVTRELEFSAKIKKGDRGNGVRRVQEWLSVHGFSTPFDNDFGEATQKYIERFQTKKGLGVTGAVDETTWNALVEPLTTALTPFEASPGLSLASAVLRVAK